MNPYFEKQLEAIALADVQGYTYVGELASEDLIHYPTHIYKYRNCSAEHNFDMIEEGYLWADIPAHFEDQFDSLINHKLKSELTAIQNWFLQHIGEIIYYYIPPRGMQAHKNGQTLQNYINAQSKFLDAEGRYSAQKAKRVMVVENKKLDPIHRREIQKVYDMLESTDFLNSLQDFVRNQLDEILQSLRKRTLVCCLTPRKNNQAMWEYYASGYTGFAIEYDISRIIDTAGVAEILTHTFRVDYSKRAPKVPMLPFIKMAFYRYFYDKNEKNPDILDTVKKLYLQLLTKGWDYRAEEEWRILSTTQRIEFPVISAVYMGYRIADEHEQRLRDICARKNIPLYKQFFDSITGTMRFDLV